MAVIAPTNGNKNKQGNKKKYLMIFAILLVLFNLVFGIWYFSAEKKKYYNDNDGDGYGNIEDSKEAQIKPWGFVVDSSDTDDNNPCIPDSTSIACLRQKAPNPPVSAPTPMPPLDTSSSTAGNGSTTTKPEIITTPKENLKVYYEDSDGDGLGDPKGKKEFAVGKNTKDYVDDNTDACPGRRGSVSNKGCPGYNIEIQPEAFIGENFIAKISGDPTLPNDKVNWQTASEIKGTTLGKDFDGMSAEVGKYNIAAEITNSDGFQMTVPKATIHLKIKPIVLSEMFKPFFVYGSALSSKAPNVAALKSRSDDAKTNLKKQIKDGILSAVKIYNNSGGDEGDLETFINADILGGTVKGPININKVVYSKSTGKITEIHLR
jgi:hypothetical protein